MRRRADPLFFKRVQQDFPHHRRQRRACKLARLEPTAALGMRDTLRRRVWPNLGAIDEKLKMKMREGVLDQSRQLAPMGFKRRVIA